MPHLQTKNIGALDYTDDSIFTFPSGLPGFESRHEFLFIKKPDLEPLVFMQSVVDSQLCFILLPILVIDSDYKLEMTPDEKEEIGIDAGRNPRIGTEIFCAAIICADEGVQPTANLLAPIVVNLSTRKGVQVIQSESGYSNRHLLEEMVTCS